MEKKFYVYRWYSKLGIGDGSIVFTASDQEDAEKFVELLVRNDKSDYSYKVFEEVNYING